MSAVAGLGVGKGILSPGHPEIGFGITISPQSAEHLDARISAESFRSRPAASGRRRSGTFSRDRKSSSADYLSPRAFPVARKVQVLCLRRFLARRLKLSRPLSQLRSKFERLGQPIPSAAADSSSEYESVHSSPVGHLSLSVDPLAVTGNSFFGTSPWSSSNRRRSLRQTTWDLKAAHRTAQMRTRASVSSLQELAHLRTPACPPGHAGPSPGKLMGCPCPETSSSEDEMANPDWRNTDLAHQVGWDEPNLVEATNGMLTSANPALDSLSDRDLLERSLAGSFPEDVTAQRDATQSSVPRDTPSGSSRMVDHSGERLASGSSQVHGTAVKPAHGVPVFVMLPLDTVSPEGVLRNPKALAVAMRALKSAAVTGVMVDVWWGVVERERPGVYDWSAYQEILQMVKKSGLALQAVMSFHACGGNVGDDVNIPLPAWVHEASQSDPDIFYTDEGGYRNPECISLFADNALCLWGRTPIQVYTDFMRAFRRAMGADFGTVVTEVAVGMGPCGELRYPAYPEGDGRWRFPGVGEFQCYDSRALADLRRAAQLAGQPAWGYAGPHDAGRYNSRPHETGFFSPHQGSWSSPYGHFFLQWYSDALVQHGERMLQAAQLAFHRPLPPNTPSPTAGDHRADGASADAPPATPPIKFSLKCAGIHWWYHSVSHAAELTSGYYNPRGRNGYVAIIELCSRYGADFNFTCVEMRNEEQPAEAQCGPQELLNQVRVCAAQTGVPMTGENALARWDQEAYDQMVANACSTRVVLKEIDDWGNIQKVEHRVPPMGALTYLRLTPQLFEERNFTKFLSFVRRMKLGADTSQGGWHHHHSHYVNHAYDYAAHR